MSQEMRDTYGVASASLFRRGRRRTAFRQGRPAAGYAAVGAGSPHPASWSNCLGTQLLLRTTRNVTLSQDGIVLVDEARSLLAQADELGRRFRERGRKAIHRFCESARLIRPRQDWCPSFSTISASTVPDVTVQLVGGQDRSVVAAAAFRAAGPRLYSASREYRQESRIDDALS